jgi:hypothetical protein
MLGTVSTAFANVPACQPALQGCDDFIDPEPAAASLEGHSPRLQVRNIWRRKRGAMFKVRFRIPEHPMAGANSGSLGGR